MEKPIILNSTAAFMQHLYSYGFLSSCTNRKVDFTSMKEISRSLEATIIKTASFCPREFKSEKMYIMIKQHKQILINIYLPTSQYSSFKLKLFNVDYTMI